MRPPLPTLLPQSADPYTLYATREYLARLATDISRTASGDRVLLATMDFHPQGFGISTIIDACIAAAERDVTVTVFLDAHTFLMDPFGHIGPLWYGRMHRQTRNKWFTPSEQAIYKLRKGGVTVVLTNPPARAFTSPVSGRSHIKASIINDIIYIGGHNLSFPLLDCMARSVDGTTANWLYDLLMQRATQPHTRLAWGDGDFSHTIDTHTKLLVDVGTPNQSLIYQQALQLIDEATDWLFISCQFFPRGQTAKHLRAAFERGVDVYLMFNGVTVHPPGVSRLAHFSVNTYERVQHGRSFFVGELPKGTPYVHAKILATTNKAMIGSHNYIQEGVRFGTAEIALVRDNATFSDKLVEVMMHQTGLIREPWYQRHFSPITP